MKTINKKLFPLFFSSGIIVIILLALYSFNFNRLNNYFSDISPFQFPSNIKKNSPWKIYQNELIGFEIKFPADWQISEESFTPQGNKITEQSNLIDIFPGNSEKDFLNKITIEAFVDGLVPDADGIWKTYTDNFKSWNLENKQVNNETEINGTKFIFIEGTSTEAGVPGGFSSKTYLTKINQGKGMLAIIVRDKNNPRSEMFSQIINTFKFN